MNIQKPCGASSQLYLLVLVCDIRNHRGFFQFWLIPIVFAVGLISNVECFQPQCYAGAAYGAYRDIPLGAQAVHLARLYPAHEGQLLFQRLDGVGKGGRGAAVAGGGGAVRRYRDRVALRKRNA